MAVGPEIRDHDTGDLMLKALGAFGLGAVFLLISAELRSSLAEEIDAILNYLSSHSPASYIVLGLAGLGGAMVWVYRAAQPRC